MSCPYVPLRYGGRSPYWGCSVAHCLSVGGSRAHQERACHCFFLWGCWCSVLLPSEVSGSRGNSVGLTYDPGEDDTPGPTSSAVVAARRSWASSTLIFGLETSRSALRCFRSQGPHPAHLLITLNVLLRLPLALLPGFLIPRTRRETGSCTILSGSEVLHVKWI